MKTALIQAMNFGYAFSWIDTREVQKGVYLKYSQQFFQTYEMN